jgi:hypothetical protein
MGAAAWAAAFAILIAITLFRFPDEWKAILRAVASILQKTKKVSITGIEAQENPPPPTPDERQAVETFFRSFDNPLVREQEDVIVEDLRKRRVEAPHDKERALLRSLALTQIILHFERVNNTIWASQHQLLRYLNERTAGATEEEVRAFYDTAKATYAAIYEHYAYERWLDFISSHRLIARNNDRFFISVAGREYLQYLIAAGKSAPSFG